MTWTGKRNILGIMVDAIDYREAVEQILRAARLRHGFAVSTSAVHGIMEGVLDQEHKFRLNHFDLVTPDGQPVRWALRILHRVQLSDRVYGPNLTLRLCEMAKKEKIGLYFYGNKPEVLAALRKNLETLFPGIRICGMEPSRFRSLSCQEQEEVVSRISESGAALVFIGLGCPRQEVWAYEYREDLSMPIVAVGGAFGVLAGQVSQAPKWMQDRGLEWLFRLSSEPRRLWRRYLLLSPAYAVLIALQALGLMRFSVDGRRPLEQLLHG